MTVQTSKNPQVDIAEDNAFFPSEYSLSQYTSPVSDLDGVDYPKPYRGKHKILVIAADERYLPTDNGKLFSTGNHPIETLLPLYHLHAAGFEFEVATISGLMTKFEYWAMPHKDEKVMPFFEQHKSLFRNPKKLADVVASLNADSEYAAIFGGVAFESQYRAQIYLSGGKPERAYAQIVGSGGMMQLYVFKGVGRSANDECFAQHLPGFADGHVFFAQVHPVHFQLFGQLYVVVENQDRFFSFTERFQLQCHCLHLFRRCLFHAQLDPFTAPFESHARRFQIGVILCLMGDKL